MFPLLRPRTAAATRWRGSSSLLRRSLFMTCVSCVTSQGFQAFKLTKRFPVSVVTDCTHYSLYVRVVIVDYIINSRNEQSLTVCTVLSVLQTVVSPLCCARSSGHFSKTCIQCYFVIFHPGCFRSLCCFLSQGQHDERPQGGEELCDGCPWTRVIERE